MTPKRGMTLTVAALIAGVAMASCGSRPSNSADSLTMLGVAFTRLDKESQEAQNLPYRKQFPSWLVLRPGSEAYLHRASYACSSAALRLSIAKLPELTNNLYHGCWLIDRTNVVTVDKIIHVSDNNYIIGVDRGAKDRFYVGGGDIGPIIPEGSPLTVRTDPPDCGAEDNPPCGSELVDGSGNPICRLSGGEDARLLDFQPSFEHRLHVQIEDGLQCPHAIGYMSEWDVNEDSVFGFEAVSRQPLGKPSKR
jgi:hypothetical protein